MATSESFRDLAEQIDHRLGPIPGHLADQIAVVLREAAQACIDRDEARRVVTALETHSQFGKEDEDMAAVGRALMEVLESNRNHIFLEHWLPAQCPSEIVCDLLNELDDKRAIGTVLAETAESFAQCTVPGSAIRERLCSAIARWRQG